MKNGVEITKYHFEELIKGKEHHQKNLKRLREHAFMGASAFAEVLNVASRFLEKDIEKTMEVVIEILEGTPAAVKESGDRKVLEAICRITGTLALCGRGEDENFRSTIENSLIPFQSKEEGEILFAFSDGIQEPAKCYLVLKGKEDEAIFQMIADMKGSEFGVSVVRRTMRESMFAPTEDLEKYFGSFSATSKVREQEEEFEKLRGKVWRNIKENRHYGIMANGGDKVLISEKDPIKKLGIEFLRFVQEGIEPPGVGIEIFLENEKIILGKINQEGKLLVPWEFLFPEVASLLHTAILLYLRDLTVGSKDTFLRVQRTRKVSGTEEESSERKTKEYLVARREIEYIPHRHIAPGEGERVRKVARRPRKIRFRKEHLRWLPPGWKASQKAKDRAKKAGFNLLSSQPGRRGQTYVSQYVSEGEKVPRKLLKDVSAARELEEILA